MHAELEAIALWCPLTKHERTCLASRCAAWRWVNDPLPQFCRAPQPDAVVDPGPPFNCRTWEFVPFNPEDDSYEARWLEPIGEAQKRRKGYCGIAGKPLGAP